MNSIILALCISTANPIILGERARSSGDYTTAIKLFQQAISDGNLSYIGEAMTRWYIHDSYEHLNNKKGSMEALWSFVSNVELFEHKIPNSRRIKDFKVREKMNLARVLMDAYWASISKKNCGSDLRACFLPDKEFLSVYAHTIPFCGSEDSTFQRVSDFTWRPVRIIEEGKKVEVITECNKTYYFRSP